MGETSPAKVSAAITNAVAIIAVWAPSRRRRRSKRSASEPAGIPTRKTGRNVAVWTSATSAALPPKLPMSHAEATACMSVPRFETSCAMNSARKMRLRSGVHGDSSAAGVTGSP